MSLLTGWDNPYGSIGKLNPAGLPQSNTGYKVDTFKSGMIGPRQVYGPAIPEGFKKPAPSNDSGGGGDSGGNSGGGGYPRRNRNSRPGAFKRGASRSRSKAYS